MLRLRIDPWATEYGAMMEAELGHEPEGEADPFVETRDWIALSPAEGPRPEVIVFIDGVQRIELNVLADAEGAPAYAAFASVAAGAALARVGRPEIEPRRARRALALTAGLDDDPVVIPCGSSLLQFEVESVAHSGRPAVQEAVARVRRSAETRLGEEMVRAGHPLVVVDGRLSFPPTRHTMAVGLIKTIQQTYLPPEQASLLFTLPLGARTPLFRIPREHSVYSWYVRLASPRSVDHPWAGLARLETLEGVGLERAISVANLTARHLPAFASSLHWDPRAPQNLYPISALEGQLHHLLGDHLWVRRAIEGHLQRGALWDPLVLSPSKDHGSIGPALSLLKGSPRTDCLAASEAP